MPKPEEEKSENTAVLDLEAIGEKIDKGETLTPEEEKVVMEEGGQVPTGFAKPALTQPAQEKEEKPEAEKKEGEDDEKPKKKKDDEEKKDEEKDEKADPLKIETELAKPEGQANLKEFNKTEKAYYHNMRRDRKKRQQAESELDTEKFKNKKLQKQIDDVAAPADDFDLDKALEGRDATDFLTVAEVREIFKKTPQKSTKPEEQKEEKPAEAKGFEPTLLQRNYLKVVDEAARKELPG